MYNYILEKYQIEEVIQNKIGLSGDQVYFLKSSQQNYYLKISNNIEIINEAKAYQYLENKVNVPKIYEFINNNGMYYLLMSEVRGKMLYELLEDDIENTIKLYASALKKLHEVDITNYDVKDINKIVEEIEPRLNQIDVHELEKETQILGIEKTYEKLKRLIPKSRDLVFVHGDYCMPNIIVGDDISFIDLGRSGVDDRYNDIAIALRSLKKNIELINKPFLLKYNQIFLETYGIDKVDKEKCEFYYLLDEFF